MTIFEVEAKYSHNWNASQASTVRFIAIRKHALAVAWLYVGAKVPVF